MFFSNAKLTVIVRLTLTNSNTNSHTHPNPTVHARSVFFSNAKLAAIVGPVMLFLLILPKYIFFGSNTNEGSHHLTHYNNNNPFLTQHKLSYL